MLYLRAAFWLLTYVRFFFLRYPTKLNDANNLPFHQQLFDRLIKHHHEQLRLSGYHDFHRATAVHKGVPLCVVSENHSSNFWINVHECFFLFHFFFSGFFMEYSYHDHPDIDPTLLRAEFRIPLCTRNVIADSLHHSILMS